MSLYWMITKSDAFPKAIGAGNKAPKDTDYHSCIAGSFGEEIMFQGLAQREDGAIAAAITEWFNAMFGQRVMIKFTGRPSLAEREEITRIEDERAIEEAINNDPMYKAVADRVSELMVENNHLKTEAEDMAKEIELLKKEITSLKDRISEQERAATHDAKAASNEIERLAKALDEATKKPDKKTSQS